MLWLTRLAIPGTCLFRRMTASLILACWLTHSDAPAGVARLSSVLDFHILGGGRMVPVEVKAGCTAANSPRTVMRSCADIELACKIADANVGVGESGVVMVPHFMEMCLWRGRRTDGLGHAAPEDDGRMALCWARRKALNARKVRASSLWLLRASCWDERAVPTQWLAAISFPLR